MFYPLRKITLHQAFFTSALLLFSALFGCEIYAGFQSFWTDSEMWTVVAAKHLFSSLPEYNFAVKPLLDLILYINFQISRAMNIHPMLGARGLFALNQTLTAGLFFLLAHRLVKNFFLSFVYTTALVSSSFFIKRYGHVRSDLLVTTLLLGLCLLETSATWHKLTTIKRLGIVLGVLSLAVAITPKAILPFAIWLIAFGRKDISSILRGRHGWWLCVVTLAAGIFYVASQRDSVHFFFASFGSATGPGYFSLNRFQHVTRFIQENSLFIPLWIFGLFCSLRKRGDSNGVGFADFANLTLLELLLYPDRLPFFIAALIPFWILPLCAHLHSTLAELPKLKPWLRPAPYLLTLYGLTNMWLWGQFLIANHSSEMQQKVIQQLAAFDDQLNTLSVYDPVGLRPFSSASNWFVGPGEDWNDATFERIKSQRPEVILFTMRLNLIGKKLTAYLDINYWTDGLGTYILRHPLPPDSGPLNCLGLKNFILQTWPETAATGRLYSVVARAADGHTKELKEPTSPSEQEGGLTWKDMEKCRNLDAPKGFYRFEVLPAHLPNALAQDLTYLFRFDPEI